LRGVDRPPADAATIPKHLAGLIPRGVGNKEITAAAPFQEAARGVVSTINRIVGEMGWQVERIAVDAPAAPPATGSRASENELGRLGLSSFRTPAASAWVDIREKCANHLRLGGSAATLPHANKIWMRFGFELFASLKGGLRAEVIEVYPFAIVRALLPTCKHKSTEQGYRDQLDAVAARTGWGTTEPGSEAEGDGAWKPPRPARRIHGGLGASLPPEGLCAFGDAQRPDDAIWVPL